MKKVLFYLLSATLVLGACKKEGCTDSNATNYDADAKTDDGSCTYPGGITANEAADNTKPTVSITMPAANTKLSTGDTLHVHGTVADNVNLASYTVSVVGSGSSTWSQEVTTSVSGTSGTVHEMFSDGITVGTYTITLTATDAKGNVSTAATVDFEVEQGIPDDSEAPALQPITVNWPIGSNPWEATTDNKIQVKGTDNMGITSLVVTLTRTDTMTELDKEEVDLSATAPTSLDREVTLRHASQGGINTYPMEVKVVIMDAKGNKDEETLSVQGKF